MRSGRLWLGVESAGDIHGVLDEARDCHATDVHIMAQAPVYFRIDGELHKYSDEVLSASMARSLACGLLSESQIHALLEMVQGSSGIRICFEHDGYTHKLAMDQKLAIYRMVQEQLNNIVKHAKATEVQIALSQANHHTLLVICDNGQGFNKTERGNGIGLNNITSRAKVFDGDVHIETEPGKGCTLTIISPMMMGIASRIVLFASLRIGPRR